MSENKKRRIGLKDIITFAVLCIGNGTIFMPAYCRSNFYDAFIEGFGVTNTQFGIMFSAFTIGMLGTYFIGGVITDKMSPRKMLTFSFAATAVLTVVLSFFPSFYIACGVYFCMGLSSTMTFYAPLIKATRQFGQRVGGESKALGFMEGGRAIWGTVSGAVVSAVFVALAGGVMGLRAVLWIYAVILVACAIASYFCFTDDAGEDTYKGNVLVQVKDCLKNPGVWILALMVMGAYAITSTMTGYTSLLATACFSIPMSYATFVALVPSVVNPIGAFIGGILGDKMGATKTVIVLVVLMMISAFAITILPNGISGAIPFLIIFVILSIFIGAVRGQYYAPMREAGIPMALSGTATGLIATIGYTPDLYLSIITGRLLDNPDQIGAFKQVIYILCGFGVFAIVMGICLMQIVKKRK